MSRRRVAIASVLVVASAGGVAACGEQGVSLSSQRGKSSSVQHGAELFAARCSGCHTLKAAGTEGSNFGVKYQERTDGPNLNQRKETQDQVLYAIRNGGFSGAIMPQNIVVGQDAQDVAEFVSKYAGTGAKRPPAPNQPGSEGGPASRTTGGSTTTP